MAGFGRCGEWFAVDHWDVTPDLICFAKGVNSGYVPLGGVVISPAIADTFKERAYPGGLTYSGHPLACAAAVASITIFKEEGILEHARTLGTDVIGPALRELQERHPSVGEVRGLGVFWAIELVRNRETREPLVPFNASGDAAGTDERGRGGLQGQGRVAVRPLQPDPRGAAVHDLRRRRAPRASPPSTRPWSWPTATTTADRTPSPPRERRERRPLQSDSASAPYTCRAVASPGPRSFRPLSSPRDCRSRPSPPRRPPGTTRPRPPPTSTAPSTASTSRRPSASGHHRRLRLRSRPDHGHRRSRRHLDQRRPLRPQREGGRRLVRVGPHRRRARPSPPRSRLPARTPTSAASTTR